MDWIIIRSSIALLLVNGKLRSKRKSIVGKLRVRTSWKEIVFTISTTVSLKSEKLLIVKILESEITENDWMEGVPTTIPLIRSTVFFPAKNRKAASVESTKINFLFMLIFDYEKIVRFKIVARSRY